MHSFKIGKHTLGFEQPLYFVADIAANHDGNLDRAFKLIELAKESGAHAAKFQNFIASKIVSRSGFDNLGGQISHQSKWEKSVYETYEDASVSYDWTERLKVKCDEVDIEYFTSPYDLESVDHVDPNVRVYKIGSGDVTWHEIIDYIAQKGKPVFIATGASTLDEVKSAMKVLQKNTKDIVLMQCNTNYTASVENFNHIALNVLKTYTKEFPDIVLGLSDHTPGHTTVLGAVVLGARVIEKHFTDNCNNNGPDHKFSMDPTSWAEMVYATRELEAALGTEEKRVMDNEVETVIIQRRGIRATRKLKAGEIIRDKDLTHLRPCTEDCLPPYRSDELIGKILTSNLEEGECIKLKDIN